MRKWTMSACLVLAFGLLPLMAAASPRGPARAAQATPGTTTATPAPAAPVRVLTLTTATDPAADPPGTWTVRPGDTLAGIAATLHVPGGWPALYTANRGAIGADPALIRPGTVLALPGIAAPVRYTVAVGDTLAGIAATLHVPGGWPALYTANRAIIGPDPNLIEPGTTLTTPHQPARQRAAQPAAPGPAHRRSGTPAPARAHRQPQATPTLAPAPAPAPAPVGSRQRRGYQPVPSSISSGTLSTTSAGMPRWLQDVLIAAGLLAAAAFSLEPAMAASRRRHGPRGTRATRDSAAARAAQPATPAHIITAEHERLIVTYSTSDDTVYVLTPPGEDPRAILRAARLIVPDGAYQDLAGYLGVPTGWPLE
ncbi:MAG TPA: LysM domain-containing protein [Trebonia sp.]|nr:LysM domain-containing protein [Trebonia sp.]